MMKERDLLDTLGPIIRDAEDRRFEAGFSGRVMERLRAEAEAPVIVLSRTLGRQFLRLAPIAAAVLVALSAYSLLGLGASSGQSVLETALGLEPLTVETAYALDQSFYAANDE
jgi:peptidoglycan/LPS O-acetylase OafA/YrhL